MNNGRTWQWAAGLLVMLLSALLGIVLAALSDRIERVEADVRVVRQEGTMFSQRVAALEAIHAEIKNRLERIERKLDDVLWRKLNDPQRSGDRPR